MFSRLILINFPGFITKIITCFILLCCIHFADHCGLCAVGWFGGLFFLLNLPLVKFSALFSYCVPAAERDALRTLSNKSIGCTLGAVFNFASARRLVVG